MKHTHMRGDEPDGATVELCLLVSGPAAALGTAVSERRLSVTVALEAAGVSAAAAGVVTSPTDADAEVVVSVFFDDRSITSGSHNFFT